MRKVMLALMASASLVVAADVKAAGFDGFYLGAKVGDNDSQVTGVSNPGLGNAYVGGEAGYNYSMGGLLLGADVWGDNHTKSVTGRDWGVDMKLGSVQDATLYYIKLGVAETAPGARPHYGVGAEHKFTQNWGALAELTYDSKTLNAVTYTNVNYTVGATYHF